MRLERSVQLGAPAWPALAAGRWGGPVRVRAGDAEYAGKVALVDVDEDARVVGAHAQARRVGGWGGVAARLELRPDGGERRVEIAGDVQLSGEAPEEAAEALLSGVAARLEDAAREPAPEPERAAPRVPPPVGAPAEESLADDPAYRRRLAARAAMAVALGAAVGVVGAAWGRRRS
ncbi:MAG TPA: hypothetical protein VHF51_14640 [Solirubrobacteraceae bacterium]|nr:hypothetical protein [Solirubrobacteraceae bacterium]